MAFPNMPGGALETVSTQRETPPGRNAYRLILILGMAAFFFVCVFFHQLSVNSEYYYVWHWKWTPSRYVYPILILCAIPFFLAQLLYQRKPARIRTALVLLSLGAFALMVGGAVAQKNPPGFSRISDVVRSRWSTGYFDTAVTLVRKNYPTRELLRRYPTLLDHFDLHPRQKPPGLLLFEIAIVRLFDSGPGAAMISGLITGFVASLGVVTTYLFIKVHTDDRDAAFFGASFLALCPSFVLFFPDFDPTYLNLTACLAVLWALALKKKNTAYAVAFGAFYAVATMITHLVGLLPVFFAAYTFVRSHDDPDFRWPRALKYLAVAIATSVLLYLALWLATGFNPIETVRQCARQNAILWDKLIRFEHYPVHSLPTTFFTDLYGFALASGWISFILAGAYFWGAARTGFSHNAWVALACVSQFLFIAAFGVLQTETARIWLFMFPMLIIPVGLELAQWSPRQRLLVHVALLLLTAAVCQSIELMTAKY